MHFDIFTLFPGMFTGVFTDSILKRAQEAGIMSVALHNIRDYAEGRHRVTDDTPYGGGGGMVMKPEPIFRAVETVLTHEPGWAFAPLHPGDEPPVPAEPPARPPQAPIILLSPQGWPFTQRIAEELAGQARIALICGRYEGVDERVRTGLVTDAISIGDFVLSGGELAAAVIVDAVTRLLPGALGCEMGAFEDSFATGLLEYPQYTRPAVFRGDGIPDILVSGDHARVARWRREQALRRTWRQRPDLLASAALSEADRAFLETLSAEEDAQRMGKLTN
ncbi:MAG: tRNA (guanosine(37)-N1)-methyltransferase TrmD [Chloroflexi bacterium HGW-Chloroflexi-1]|nr:MAG: tRNA (guanosine(37)-N1)-methyltransferase TrmD [Chloroflexi bacterium HGW-Chloroflexi-1]